jgi:hypothetical protein
MPDPEDLPEIPLIDLGREPPIALLDHAAAHLDRLMAGCERHYGRLVLRVGDAVTRRWLERADNPYRHDIARIARRVGRPGATMLNLSYEWSCTTGVAPDPGQAGSRLLRTLDWPTPALGASIVVARQEGAAGPYCNVTWPGFAGVLTAMAPGRFSAAINQPPLKKVTPSLYLDWLISRPGVWRRQSLPPAHLLRRVFDECRSYGEALAMLRDTPICVPVFFTLSGLAADEGAVIERREEDAAVLPAPASISNHWRRLPQAGHARGEDSEARLAMMEGVCGAAGNDFAWLRPPILNPATRIAVIANAACGSLIVQGWEEDGAATAVLRLAEPPAGETRHTTRDRLPAAPA